MLKNEIKTSKPYKDFAAFLDVVYFGTITDKDDIEVVKGVTFTPIRKDKHYLSGSYDGFDVTVFKRESTLEHPNAGSEKITYSIVRVSNDNNFLPHIMALRKHYSQVFLEHVYLKYNKLKIYNDALRPYNMNFTDLFDVFVDFEDSSKLHHIFTPLAMQTIYQQFASYGLEVNHEGTFVYLQGEASFDQLKQMLSEALWFTEHIELSLQEAAKEN